MSNILPINSYFGNLIEASLGEIGPNSTPAMILTFELTHENQGGAWADLTPVRRDVMIWLSEKAKDSAFADLRTLGFNGDFDAPRFADDLYQGAELLIEHELYQGKTQERLRLAKLATRQRKSVAADLKRSLAAQFKTAASATARPATPPPARPGVSAAPAGGAPATVATAGAAASGGMATAPMRPRQSVGGGGADEPPFARLGEFDMG